MVELRDVSIEYERRNRFGRSHATVRALDQINLRIEPGARLGITGPSGAGKSTLARCIAGWLEPSAGLITRAGAVQLVMQDSGGSLNPRFRASQAIEEPLRIGGLAGHPAQALLREVGIDETRTHDLTSKFSGGQRARLSLARALAALAGAANSLLILDESLSPLDDETRDQILLLLQKRNRMNGLALLIVAHDRELLTDWTDRVLTLHAGRLAD